MVDCAGCSVDNRLGMGLQSPQPLSSASHSSMDSGASSLVIVMLVFPAGIPFVSQSAITPQPVTITGVGTDMHGEYRGLETGNSKFHYLIIYNWLYSTLHQYDKGSAAAPTTLVPRSLRGRSDACGKRLSDIVSQRNSNHGLELEAAIHAEPPTRTHDVHRIFLNTSALTSSGFLALSMFWDLLSMAYVRPLSFDLETI
ncbi:hypothetical protein SCLCIDRAFT_466494 [Scleroderma citrinum Foug A]|uniref:Uncharacterized protein n=1 Tax=Scleroderma citrinum Foug A TaxID=1036808 RepID=A0A0C3CWX3_9AGAM|nr:hypothetical protein SCLCIDRAFT_466494 [Scleroderma citrinum Foug A]